MSEIQLTSSRISAKLKRAQFAILVSEFNKSISRSLLEGSLRGFKDHRIPLKNILIIHVPGAFEIPFVCKKLIDSGKCKAIIALGVVIKGETEHYQYVCKETADGIMRLNLAGKTPIIFDILMVDDKKLALARASLKDMRKNKGYSAALSALKMARIIDRYF